MVSGQMGNKQSVRYHTRMNSPARFRSFLLNSTLYKAHYRSLYTTSFTQNSVVGVNACAKTGLLTLLPVATPFWTAAGGALPIDSAIGVPGFQNSSVVLRGGRSEVSVGVPGPDAMKLRVYLLYIRPGADQAGFNALTSVPAMWDPSHFIDFEQSFKLIHAHEYVVLGNSRPFTMTETFRPKKIDFDEYQAGEGHLAYCFVLQQLTDINTAVDPIIFTISHSVSFSGDAT